MLSSKIDSMHTFSPEELKALRNNQRDYFKNYCAQKKQDVLYEAVSIGQMQMIQHLMEQGVEIKNSTCLGLLAEKKNKVEVFEYLHSKGIILSQSGGYAFFRACLHNRAENAQYLADHIPEKSAAVSRALNCIINKEHSQTKTISITAFENTLRVLLKKSTPQMLECFAQNQKKELDANYKYALNLYYDVHLENKIHQAKTVKI